MNAAEVEASSGSSSSSSLFCRVRRIYDFSLQPPTFAHFFVFDPFLLESDFGNFEKKMSRIFFFFKNLEKQNFVGAASFHLTYITLVSWPERPWCDG